MLQQTLTLLRMHGIRPSRRAGQQQVIDLGLLERMVSYAEVSKRDVVLEIGAGVGNLTQLLAERAQRVIAVERDGRFLRALRERLRGYENVEFMHADILRMELPKFDKVVANLPYGISSEVTFKLLEHEFELAVLMYQREFAQRLVARPGSDDYGRLTVNAYYRAQVELLEEVPPSAFLPPPKVVSALVRLRPREPPFRVRNEEVFFDVVRALFQHRRQKVRNALYHSFAEVFPNKRLSKGERRAMIERRIPEGLLNARAMDLPPEKFWIIADLLAVNP